MKLLVFTGVFFLGQIFLNNNSKKCKYLEVYMMSSFRNDSINIRTEISNSHSMRLNTNLVLGQATSFYFVMKEKDSTIYIKDIINKNSDSIKYHPEYPYLYIYYRKPIFTFRYSKKL